MPNKVGRPTRKVERIPMGRRAKLHVGDKIPGYHLHWLNDKDGRIEEALAAGYVHVERREVPKLGQGALHQENTDLNSKVSKIVSKGTGPALRAYLMKQKDEWYKADQMSKEGVNQMVDDALRQNTPGGNVVENQYVPKGHTQQI